MTYCLSTPDEQQAMLQAIGVRSVEEVFGPMRPEVRLQRPRRLPPMWG